MKRGSLLGMGGVLLNDAPAHTALVGNPASPLKILDDC